jgi:hypothetical protein
MMVDETDEEVAAIVDADNRPRPSKHKKEWKMGEAK